MRDSSDWSPQDRLARAAFYMGDPKCVAAAHPRELRIARIIAGAPRFPMEEIADDLLLVSQGGLRGHVRDEELN